MSLPCLRLAHHGLGIVVVALLSLQGALYNVGRGAIADHKRLLFYLHTSQVPISLVTLIMIQLDGCICVKVHARRIL